MKIKNSTLKNPQPVRNERQITYMQQAEERERKKRADRLNRLRSAEAAIKRATTDFDRLDEGEAPEIRLREGFIRLATRRTPGGLPADPDVAGEMNNDEKLRRDVETRPPLTRLIFRRSFSLPLLLTAIYVAHLESKPGKRFENRHGLSAKAAGESPFSWAQLSGMDKGRSDSTRARRSRVTRALDELAAAGMVTLAEGSSKYEKWCLAHEDDVDGRYTVPGESAKAAMKIPAEFFLRGWHLVLTPPELATYLIIAHLTHMQSQPRMVPVGELGGVSARQAVRDGFYGLSGEAYETIHELEEFRLIDIHDPMPERRRGKIRPGNSTSEFAIRTENGAPPLPYNFTLRDIDPAAQAIQVVVDSLTGNPVPPLPPRVLAAMTLAAPTGPI